MWHARNSTLRHVLDNYRLTESHIGKYLDHTVLSHISVSWNWCQQVVRGCEGYGDIVFPHCPCDSRKKGHVVAYVGYKSFRLQACKEDGTLQVSSCISSHHILYFIQQAESSIVCYDLYPFLQSPASHNLFISMIVCELMLHLFPDSDNWLCMVNCGKIWSGWWSHGLLLPVSSDWGPYQMGQDLHTLCKSIAIHCSCLFSTLFSLLISFQMLSFSRLERLIIYCVGEWFWSVNRRKDLEGDDMICCVIV